MMALIVLVLLYYQQMNCFILIVITLYPSRFTLWVCAFGIRKRQKLIWHKVPKNITNGTVNGKDLRVKLDLCRPRAQTPKWKPLLLTSHSTS